jgi:hypothetical protein
MTQPSDVLEEAARWLGYAEGPDGSNDVPPITPWWPMSDAWCACFVSWVFWNVGLPLGPYDEPDHAGFLWVSDGFEWFTRGQGNAVGLVAPMDARPGDPLAFEWGSTAGGYDHTGICVENLGYALLCIEGNVGNRVGYFTRYPWEIAAAGRPRWSEVAPPANRRRRMFDSLTTRDDNPANAGRGVEVTTAMGLVAYRWETVPAGHAAENWHAWETIEPTSGALPPIAIDSVDIRENAAGCYEVVAWHSDDVNAKARCWQVAPGGRWDGWVLT